MDKPTLSAAILIISDTASEDPTTDKAGEILSTVFRGDERSPWQVTETKIVRDDVLAIQRDIVRWCDGESHVNVVVTSGGTGFAVKDHTPEAVNPLIHRHAPGLV